jgi:hypothetical protein
MMKQTNLKNKHFLNELSKRTQVNSQLSYYWNVAVVCFLASICSKFLDFDWKVFAGSFVLFLFFLLNYWKVSSDLKNYRLKTLHVEQLIGEDVTASDMSQQQSTSVPSKIPVVVNSPMTSRIPKPKTPMINPTPSSLSAKNIPLSQSPLLTQRRPQPHSLEKLSSASRPVISLRSPETNSHTQDNFDLSRASRIALEAVNGLTPPPPSATAAAAGLMRDSRGMPSGSPNYSSYNQSGTAFGGSSSFAGLNSSFGGAGNTMGMMMMNQSSSNQLFPSREYHLSPMGVKQPVASNTAVQSKDALQSLGLTQIPDEWMDELKTILGKHLHVIMDM